MFVLPVNRDKPPVHTPWVTWGLIVVNSVVWIGLAALDLNERSIQSYGLRPAHWAWSNLFAHMFLHVGFLHLAGNMYFLWMFAPKLEERLGQIPFLLSYLVSGVGAASLHSLLSPGSTLPLVGASGAISGVAGMYFVLFPRSPFELQLYFGWWLVKKFRSQTRTAVGVWIGEQFLLGLITSSIHSVGIAFWAHVGGFATGLMISGVIVATVRPEEREKLLHPEPLSELEKNEFDEVFADRVEQKSELTTLKLGD